MARFAGSSPLARGLRLRECLHRQVARIIPARAGFTGTGSLSQLTISDHPRSRGVYWNQHELQQRNRGSSPLARGLLDVHIAGLPRNGIIPARAGFTQDLRGREAPSADHPRSRGVYVVSTRLCRWREGIIPARAGFTGCTQDRATPAQDHPRSRGVYHVPALQVSATKGSSPLARGLRPIA